MSTGHDEGSAGVKGAPAAGSSQLAASSAIQKRACQLYAALRLEGVMNQEAWIDCCRQAREELEER